MVNVWLCLGVVVAVLAQVVAVDRSKFRTCAQTGFCKRNRDLTAQIPFQVEQLQGKDAYTVVGKILTSSKQELDLSLQIYKDGVLRVRITESQASGLPPRYESPDILLDPQVLQGKLVKLAPFDGNVEEPIVKSHDGTVQARIRKRPFSIDVLNQQGETVVAINKHGKMYFEVRKENANGAHQQQQQQQSEQNAGAENKRKIIDWGEDGKPIYEDGGSDEDDGSQDDGNDRAEMAVDQNSLDGPESFGGHTDNRPNGATSVGFDVSFPGVKHVFGLPEHASAFSLKTTRGGTGGYDEPYRMYNLDVFEYEIDVPMALYGHIPVVIGQKASHTSSVFFNNPSEMFVDVQDEADGKQVRFMSESGILEIMVMVGPRPMDVFRQYASMTGTTPTPPMFAIAYHQCRWNYRDEKDVREVNAEFEKHDLPYDVIWLDIEHTDGKRYFTWDKDKFPTPEQMQENIAHFGRKMVTIVDPHIKRDTAYYIHREAEAQGLYIKDKNGRDDFKGWCWPGDSSYLDFTNPKVRDWWADQFSFDRYQGSTDILYTWNDMNEPSVFNGPEVSMSKESLSLDSVEHREWHNLYGFYQHMATADGLVKRTKNGKYDHAHRPFVLSRSFYAGSQRHGAIWTGDNAAEWSHLKIASDMLLSLNIAGLPFAGADVGGFFKNPDEELLQRWYQAGAFQPFFRAHAHIDTKRREPWLFGEEVLARIAKAIKTRYSLLPLWYTLYHEHEIRGDPVMRPLWSLAPGDEQTFALGDQWLVGHELLVKPVTDPGVTAIDVYLPQGTSWYQFEEPHEFHEGGKTIHENAPLDKIPVFQRAGSIVPKKVRVRRSSKAMLSDPYTLYIASDPKAGSNASGMIYVDDELTQAYATANKYCDVTLSYTNDKIIGKSNCNGGFAPTLTVERIVILGVNAEPKRIVLEETKETLQFRFDASQQTLTIRKPVRSFINIPFEITTTV